MNVILHLMRMMQTETNRRINYISVEDFYFISYSILLVLHHLCGKSHKIKDHRKLAYLIQLLGDERLLGILERSQGEVKTIQNPFDRELLFSSYTQAELHKRETYKILFSLEKRNIVRLERTETAEVLDVTLLYNKIPKNYFDYFPFKSDATNAVRIKKLFPRLTSLTFETFIERLYRERGVKAWAS